MNFFKRSNSSSKSNINPSNSNGSRQSFILSFPSPPVNPAVNPAVNPLTASNNNQSNRYTPQMNTMNNTQQHLELGAQQQQQHQQQRQQQQPGYGSLDNFNTEFTQFTTLEFFDCFIKSASNMGLLKTPLPNQLTRYHVRTASIQLLQAARIDAQDLVLTDDVNGGTIALNHRGLFQVESYLAFKVETKAATNIQRLWKGYTTRKRLLNAFLAESTLIEKQRQQKVMRQMPAQGQVVQQKMIGEQQHHHHQSESSLLPPPPIEKNSASQQQKPLQPAVLSSSSLPETGHLEEYINKLSSMYHSILHAQRPPSTSATPSQDEIEFMKMLNHQDTFKVCYEYLAILANLENEPRIMQRRMTILPGMKNQQDTMSLYSEFVPKIVAWLGLVLQIQFDPSHDLLYILRSGDILCRLLVCLYPTLSCVLLQKGPEYGLHKLVFFLEFCKSLHIKRSLLFSINDILVKPEKDLNRKSALIVVRALIAVEKHARKNGWEGPVMGLKQSVSQELGVGSGGEGIVDGGDRNLLMIQDPSPSSSLLPPTPLPPQPPTSSNTAAAMVEETIVPTPVKPAKKKRGRPTPPSIIASSMSTLTPIIEDETSARNIGAAFNDDEGIDGQDEVADDGETLNLDLDEQAEEEIPAPVPKEMPDPLLTPEVGKSLFGPDFDLKRLMANSADLKTSLSPEALPQDQGQSPGAAVVTPVEAYILTLPEEKSVAPSTTLEHASPLKKDVIDENDIIAYTEVVERRNKRIDDFISEEQSYMRYLNSIATYLDQLIGKKKRKSTTLSSLNDGAYSETMKGNAPPFTLSTNPLPQHPSESNHAYTFRLETEITELGNLLGVVENMLGVHQLFLHLISRSKRVLGPLPATSSSKPSSSSATYSCFLIASSTMEFITALQTPYVTFAVHAFSHGESFKFSPRDEEAIVERVNRFIKDSLGMPPEDQVVVQEPTAREWRVFLLQAIHRLTRYQALLNQIPEESKLFWMKKEGGGSGSQMGSEVLRDNRKLRMAAARLGCIHESIVNHLNSKNAPMSLFTFHRTLTPPTCITHSLKCHFTSSSRLDLILVKGNILFIYRIYTTKTTSDLTSGQNTARLELLHEFTLQGMVTSMDVVRTRSANKDSLLLTFGDAKMSLIEYSVFTQNLTTISMHNYDREEFKRDIGYKGIPKVQVDHQSRCAVLHFYRTFFAILPFKHDSSIGTGIEEDEETRKYPFLPSYVEPEIEKSIRNVLDFKFLYGYLEPTLAILYEPVQTFVGRLACRKDTVSLIVISLDLHQKTYPVLYKVDGLPYNCTHIEAVPAPLGGVLIFSHNALIHLDQTHTPGFAAIVNPFFDMESHFKAVPSLDGTPVIPVKNKPASVYVKSGKTSDCKELGVSLDGCHATFLSPDIVLVILKTGEMLQVDLIGDDNAGRSWKRKRGGVKDIKIKKLGLTASSPSCITPLSDLSQYMKPQILSRISQIDDVRHYSNYFFVGSMVSDAMLIQYFQPIEDKASEGGAGTQDVDMLDDELDEELYGRAAEQPARQETGSSVSSNFKFKVCDTILVAGPIRNIAVGKPAPYTANEYVGEPLGAYLEVVACGGYDTHGSLLVMHETVRPQIISSFPLGDADDIWSVRVSATEQAISEQFHKYLVISRGSGTSILRTGEELEELENSGFYVEGPTVCVGTALNESVVVQVYPNGIVILSEDGKRLSETSIGNDDVWIVSCYINDPYAAVLLNTGELQLVQLDNSNDPLRVVKELKMSIPIACIALYTDNSPVQHFPTVQEMDARPIPKGEGEGEQSRPTVLHGISLKEKMKKSAPQFDDDDMDLYGDALVVEDDVGEEEEPIKSLFEEEDEKEKQSDINEDLVREAAVRHWCFIVDDSGTLRILSLPDLEERFIFYNFRLAPRFVYDHVSEPDDLETGTYPLQIDEILVVDLGSDAYRNYPFVVMRTNKADVFVYRIIPSIEHTPGTNGDRISIRMVRVEQNYISREPQAYADAEGDKLNPIDPPTEPPKFIKKVNLIPFDRIGVEKQQLYAGVVVTGARPVWIMMEYSGVREGAELIIQEGFQDSALPSAPRNASNAIRIHPMLVDGPISSFAPIHNINIPFGFAYINGKGLFRLCQLSPHFSYDRHWPVCKVPLGRSAHKISYHSVSETYILGTSTPTVFEIDKARYMAAVAAGVIADGEELPDSEKKVSGILDVIEDREPGMYLPEISAYQLELISPVTWETVDIIKMSQFEQILSIQVVELASKENTSGKKLFVAVGTGFMRSEDLSCRGRLLVYDVIDVVPEPGRPQTNHKLKAFFSADEKQPVTAICGCNGYLLAAIGTKILMYAMEDGELNGVAFLDVSIFVVSLSAVKNFITIGDAFKGVWFVVFQEDPPKLVLLGKDLYPVHTFGADMIVGGSDLGIIVSDDQNNLHVLTYEPEAIQSLGGQRLLRRGEMNLGYEIQTFAPVTLKAARSGQTGIRTGLVAGTSEGGISMVAPVGEKLFKRLYGLYSRMVTHLEHPAGLNPRGFRQIKLPHKSIHAASFVTGPPGPRGILDGDLLNRFLHLPLVYQRELAKAIGSKDDRILDDLLELAISLEYF